MLYMKSRHQANMQNFIHFFFLYKIIEPDQMLQFHSTLLHHCISKIKMLNNDKLIDYIIINLI